LKSLFLFAESVVICGPKKRDNGGLLIVWENKTTIIFPGNDQPGLKNLMGCSSDMSSVIILFFKWLVKGK